MWDKLPAAIRPSGRGVTENIIAGWIGTGIAALAAMIGASILSWLAAPQSDQEWVKWFLGSLLVLSFAWMAFAVGWRKLYPLTTESARASADAPTQSDHPATDADWMTVVTDLQPVTRFLRDAQRRGWRFEDPKSQAIEFFGLLREAATRAYEQTRGSVAAGLAEASGKSPLTWYAHAIWERVPIYGSFPPSRLIERIPDEEKNRFSFHMPILDLVLKEHSGPGRYVDLHVRGSELKQAIRSIAKLG